MTSPRPLVTRPVDIASHAIRHPAAARRPGSRAAIILGLCYAAALVYGTLYPWRGWREIGLPWYGFVTKPWSPYWTWLDILVNIGLYLPLGALVTEAARRRLRPAAAGTLAVLLGAGLSFALESAQTWLPGRVPSRLDWLANSVGASIGALAVLAWSAWRAGSRRAPWQRAALWAPGSDAMLALVAAWLIAQLGPRQTLFETGALAEPWRTRLIGVTLAADPAAAFEVLAIPLSMLAIGIILYDAMPRHAPRPLALIVLFAIAVGLHAAAARWLYPGWSGALRVSSSAQGGLLLGAMALVLVSYLRRPVRLWIALLATLAGAALPNLLPAPAYLNSGAPAIAQAGLRNAQAVVEVVSLCWPLAAIAVLITRLRATSSRRGPRARPRL